MLCRPQSLPLRGGAAGGGGEVTNGAEDGMIQPKGGVDMTEVAIAACQDYAAEHCRAALEQALAPLGGLA